MKLGEGKTEISGVRGEFKKRIDAITTTEIVDERLFESKENE